MGILIAIDGVDASGKQTQTELLQKRLMSEREVRLVSFPMYDNPSSTAVKLYLNGTLGKNPGDVNAYAASAFFAVDRYITYKTDWGADYLSDKIILADRYVSSNMIHQAGKIADLEEKNKFLDWLHDFEYNKFALPKPDITVFLDMPVEYGARLMAQRSNKIDGTKQKDIHESDKEYLRESYENAVYIAKKYGWSRINCVDENGVRSVLDIHNEIYKLVRKFI
ncbi:MAG: deoxynucleoside kinase [Clostridiales bacterium]|nr:deoxynucleoside kinase [Clostridiales bacterium]